MSMAKAWVGLVGAIVTALTAALSDDVLSISDIEQVAITAIPAIGTLFSVYQIENRPRTGV